MFSVMFLTAALASWFLFPYILRIRLCDFVFSVLCLSAVERMRTSLRLRARRCRFGSDQGLRVAASRARRLDGVQRRGNRTGCRIQRACATALSCLKLR